MKIVRLHEFENREYEAYIALIWFEKEELEALSGYFFYPMKLF